MFKKEKIHENIHLYFSKNISDSIHRFLKNKFCVRSFSINYSDTTATSKTWTQILDLDPEKSGPWETLKPSLGFKYASEGFLYHTLLKEPLEVDLKWNPLKWNWLFLKNSFRWSKGFLRKKRRKILCLIFLTT